MMPNRLFDQPQERWKVSAVCAVKHLDCTVRGITRDGGCGGACCRTMGFWPPKAGSNRVACDHLGPDGCRLGDSRPVTCLLYPFHLSRTGTLVLSHTGYTLGNTCGPCRGLGPRVIDALFENFVTLFGIVEASRIRDEVTAGQDAMVDVPAGIQAAIEEERVWEAENTVPMPRDYEALLR